MYAPKRTIVLAIVLGCGMSSLAFGQSAGGSTPGSASPVPAPPATTLPNNPANPALPSPQTGAGSNDPHSANSTARAGANDPHARSQSGTMQPDPKRRPSIGPSIGGGDVK